MNGKTRLVIGSLLLVLVMVFISVGCAQSAPAPSPAPAKSAPAPAPAPTAAPAPKPAAAPVPAAKVPPAAPAPAAKPQQVVWKLNGWMPPTGHDSLPPLQKAADEILKRSNGALKIEIFPAFSLGFKPATWFRDHKEGLIDISDLFNQYTSGEEPSFSVIELNCLFKNREQSIKAADALADFKKKIYKEVWNSELIARGYAQTLTAVVSTKGKPISKLEDLKGLKIRVASPQAGQLLAAFGAVPQTIPRSDIYMSMKTGVIDGFDGGWNTLTKEKLNEVMDYSVLYGISPALQEDIVVSAKQWNQLPDNVKQIVRDVFKEWGDFMAKGAIAGKNDWEDKAALVKAGVKCVELPASEQDKIRLNAIKQMEEWAQKQGGRTIEAWNIVKPILTQ